jgi:hypothetical protein
MRTVIITLAGVMVVVLAWFFFTRKDLSHYQDLIDTEQHRLETQLPKLLEDIPGYLTLYVKYFPTAVDTSWAQELDQAADDCALVLKTVGATREVTTDEVDRLNVCLTKLYAAYEGTRDQINIVPDRSPAALKDPDFADRTHRLASKFVELTTHIDQVNSLVSSFLNKKNAFPNRIAAGVFGFPKWIRFYSNGSQRYP